MKTVHLLFAVMIIMAGACSSPKKATTPKSPSRTVTRDDVLRGGTSFSNPVMIMVQKESAGIDEEYKWLANNYPRYSLVRRTHVKRSSKHFDIIRIKTQQGLVKDIYFDSTRFWGKN